MEVVRRVHSMREICRQARVRGRRVGLVPTMGALHEGHLSLIRRTQEMCDLLVVSIFVNPAQFGSNEDLARYPRELTADVDRCIGEKVDYVFAPEVDELYPPGSETMVDLPALSAEFEGASRPGHFRGVATVVLKLFEIARPTLAGFGQKDAQQAVLIERMVRDLLLDVEVLVLPTIRDEDGLALSSRNRFLTAEQRRAALALPGALAASREVVAGGERRADRILAPARAILEAEEGVAIDYLALVDRRNFQAVGQLEDETFLIVAAQVGEIRLLDNITLSP